jgi:hypothetical protein
MAAHLAGMGVQCEMYLFGWLQTVFLKCLPLASAAWVWDCFLLDGVPALYRTALGILSLLEPFALERADKPGGGMDFTIACLTYASGSGRREEARVWGTLGRLETLKRAVESVNLSHSTLALLEDIANDPCFYKHVQL